MGTDRALLASAGSGERIIAVAGGRHQGGTVKKDAWSRLSEGSWRAESDVGTSWPRRDALALGGAKTLVGHAVRGTSGGGPRGRRVCMHRIALPQLGQRSSGGLRLRGSLESLTAASFPNSRLSTASKRRFPELRKP